MSFTLNVMIAGAAGQGLATTGTLLARCLVRAGYDVCVTQDVMSRIRGGHNTFCIRTGVDIAYAGQDTVDILLALNQDCLDRHHAELTAQGFAVGDSSLHAEDISLLRVPFADLVAQKLYHNVLGLGILTALLGIDKKLPAQLLEEQFTAKGSDIVQKNCAVLDQAYSWLAKQKNQHGMPLPAPHNTHRRMLLTGNEAIALGALAAGVGLCSFYPMTPGTSVPDTLAKHGKHMGVVVEQVEDEIAAVNMAIGASYAGIKALVSTAGGGFALMTEAVSLAGVAEVPLVCVVAMRPGPATGMATRTEQADLNLVLYAGHGEFPRIIFAPTSHEECFLLTYKAFDLAERFAVPAFILSDQHLESSCRSTPLPETDSLPAMAAPLSQWEGTTPYEPYAYTDSGVSPRLVPGATPHPVLCDSHEHTPDGHITEDISVRNAMQEKRLRKEQGLKEHILPPHCTGDTNPALLLVCWGSTRPAAEEAAALLRQQGTSVAVLAFSQLWPLDTAHFMETLQAAGRICVVEGNSTGQFRTLLTQLTCIADMEAVYKYDGRPFTAHYIVSALQEEH